MTRYLWLLPLLLLAACEPKVIREKTIVAPPVLEKSFWVHGDEVSPEYLEQMALFFAGLALTYHPDNVDDQVRLFLRYADPAVYGALASRLEADAEKVRRNNLSSVFYPQEVRIKGRRVALTGQLATFVGRKSVETRQGVFRFHATSMRRLPVCCNAFERM